MKKELTKLQEVFSTIFLIGFGITGSLFFIWLIKVLLKAIFKMEKEIEINGKKIVIKEFKYIQALELQGLDKGELGKKMMELSTNLTEEEINQLSLKEGIELQKSINEVNGLDVNLDFQKPTVEKAN